MHHRVIYRKRLRMSGKQLKCRRLPYVVYIFFIGQSVKTDLGKIGNFVFSHDFTDSCKDIFRHFIIDFQRRTDKRHLIAEISDQKPRINRNAVTADTRTGRKDIDTRMHITDADDLVNIHSLMTAELHQLICKCNIHRTVCIFDHLCHFGSRNIRQHDCPFAERSIDLSDIFSDFRIVCTDGS